MVAWQKIGREALAPAGAAVMPEILDGLKYQVARLRTTARVETGEAALSTGITAIDRVLPWGGLPRAGLHEIAGWRETDFALTLIDALLAQVGETRPVIWCGTKEGAQQRGRLYGPGLALKGLPMARLILVDARRERDALWAMEEALTSGAAAGAVGEFAGLGMAETQRLQLAATRGGAMGLILRGPVGDRAPSAALTRWRAEPCPAASIGGGRGLPGSFRFDLSLWHARGGCQGHWSVEQNAETFRLALAA